MKLADSDFYYRILCEVKLLKGFPKAVPLLLPIAICTPHCAADDEIHVLNLIFDTNTHDFCHSSRFFLMRSRHSSNRVISSSEKPL